MGDIHLNHWAVWACAAANLLLGGLCLQALAMAYNLAFFLGGAETDWAWGLAAGFLAGGGWAALSFVLIGLFERRSSRYMLINGGFLTVWFTVAGLVLGAWR